MLNFKKGYNFKIVSITISLILLSTTIAYSASYTRETLRLPMGSKDIYEEMKLIFEETISLEEYETMTDAVGIISDNLRRELQDNPPESPKESDSLKAFAENRENRIPRIAKRLELIVHHGTYTKDDIETFRKLLCRFLTDGQLASRDYVTLTSFLLISEIASIYELPEPLFKIAARINDESNFYIDGIYLGTEWLKNYSGILSSDLISYKRGGTILDAGCGWGVDAVSLAVAFPSMNILAIDANPINIRHVYRLLERLLDRGEKFLQTPFNFGNFTVKLDDLNHQDFLNNSLQDILFKSFFFITDVKFESMIREALMWCEEGGRIIIHSNWTEDRGSIVEKLADDLKIEVNIRTTIREGDFKVGIIMKRERESYFFGGLWERLKGGLSYYL